ncbi:hypothetical protein CC1G_03088 [Coprinopsis cinerea okayama7|uniref:intramembrane prenyl-peptidase Rce1 n=1 Tax=Coprinopsis cinerea (strain Okayama-7 / 130 / ATCC MYA-4618 / FGSC 9003) TaxID=240176 RepID=A8PEW3_COPC7|nr:hypothetical protein CC1G_03088 [Coprinopsis cinerea okayama7\|eukprot:XP_001840859.2 hypothetical protein CC1G_03088 [Coprinopsis cinerea okayama7\
MAATASNSLASDLLRISPITQGAAHLLALLFGICYVGSLYVSNKARLKFEANAKTIDDKYPRAKLAHERWRDDPDVMRARVTAVSIASILCCLGVVALVWWRSDLEVELSNLGPVLYLSCSYLGFKWDFPSDFNWSSWSDISALGPHVVVPVLFLGPLYATYLDGTLPGQQFWSLDEHVFDKYFSLMGLRTYILGPITEEIVFRSCVLTAFHMAHMSRKQMVFLTPLTFGVEILFAYLLGMAGFVYVLPKWTEVGLERRGAVWGSV